jgi:septum formation protein
LTVRLVLASASPARLRTLRSAGLRPEVWSAGSRRLWTSRWRRAYALHLAGEKARAVAGRITGDAYVLGCDSVLELDGEAHGKPASIGGGRAMAADARSQRRPAHRSLPGRAAEGTAVQEVASTVVHFADVSDAEIDAYVATGEPLVVAGAFTLDGLGGAFVRGVEGDRTMSSACPYRCSAVSSPRTASRGRPSGTRIRAPAVPTPLVAQ